MMLLVNGLVAALVGINIGIMCDNIGRGRNPEIQVVSICLGLCWIVIAVTQIGG